MKTTKHYCFLLFIILALCQCKRSSQNDAIKNGYDPKDGFVPNSETAITIAKTIWTSLYGESVLSDKAYTAKLIGDSIWIVEGDSKKENFGGVTHIEIRKSDCKILKLIQYK